MSSKPRSPGRALQSASEPDAAQVQALGRLFAAAQYAQVEPLAQAMTQDFPHYGIGWKALGAVQKALGRNTEALAALHKAVALCPTDAEAHSNLGAALREAGQPQVAIASYRQALALRPDAAQAHGNLGNALADLGQLHDAARSLRKAISLEPRYAQAHSNLGNVLLELAQWQEAEHHFALALQIDPQLTSALNGGAYVLCTRGIHAQALALVRKSLALHDSEAAQRIFVECAKYLPLPFQASTQDDTALRQLMQRALTVPWGRPSALTVVATALALLEPEAATCVETANQAWPQRLQPQALFGVNTLGALQRNTLLHSVLTTAQIGDVRAERFLTQCRSAFLQLAARNEAPQALLFMSALAQQCFVNDYVFSTTADEELWADQLAQRISQALNTGASVAPQDLLVLAMVRPLHGLPQAAHLLGRSAPPELQAVVRQQVQEPATEQLLRSHIPAITTIADAMSVKVQNQYEESPYPRWQALPARSDTATVQDTLRKLFAQAPNATVPHNEAPSILIAGCGTGQQAIECSQRFSGAQVLAIDLSMRSLAYAKRKTQDMGVGTITYAQADLLQLSTLPQAFDVIESCGVLHHLNDPWQGWRSLLAVLRPGGVMKLGFYSALARRHVVRAREAITKLGFESTPQGIRAARQQLLDHEAASQSQGGCGGATPPDNFGTVTQSSDFFTTSTCRDLLFHVQEHRTSIAELAQFISNHNLEFLGFETEPHVLWAYRQRFTDDPRATNLDHWQVFENNNPDVFFNMYQFWVQKRP